MPTKDKIKEVLDILGKPDSSRIEALVEQIKIVDDYSFNCVSVGLHLVGSEYANKAVEMPMTGLWASE